MRIINDSVSDDSGYGLIFKARVAGWIDCIHQCLCSFVAETGKQTVGTKERRATRPSKLYTSIHGLFLQHISKLP